jgi:hypothetical protein
MATYLQHRDTFVQMMVTLIHNAGNKKTRRKWCARLKFDLGLSADSSVMRLASKSVEYAEGAELVLWQSGKQCTLLLYTPLIHSSRTLLSYTTLIHSSHTLLSYTLSYTPLIHSSHTLSLVHSSRTLLSLHSLIHSSHTQSPQVKTIPSSVWCRSCSAEGLRQRCTW